MAKARYHKHQRVFVEPVGTWALIEQVKPQWIKDVERPVKIFYDCGLGRDFSEDELGEEEVEEADHSHFRLLRLKNKWQSPEECAHHPHPGTFPVLVTDEKNWGGWRVPGAEYDRDPHRVEAQARLLTHAPQMMQLSERLVDAARNNPDFPPELMDLARRAQAMIKAINITASGPRAEETQEQYVTNEAVENEEERPREPVTTEPDEAISREPEQKDNSGEDFDIFGLSDDAA